MNSVDEHKQFTPKFENYNRLLFLDVMVFRENN